MIGDLIREAANGIHGKDQQRIAEVGLDWIETLLRKNNDYGGSAWQVPVLAPECDIGSAIRVRMSDKVARLNRLLDGASQMVSSESIDDTMKDLGAYALLYLARPKPQTTTTTKEN